MNRKFSCPAAQPEDARVPLGAVSLKDIMCLEYERTVANNYVIRFENRLFQIIKTKKFLPRDNVTVRFRLDGSVLWKNTKLLVKELTHIQDYTIQKAASGKLGIVTKAPSKKLVVDELTAVVRVNTEQREGKFSRRPAMCSLTQRRALFKKAHTSVPLTSVAVNVWQNWP